MDAYRQLLTLVRTLRGPDGCEWDGAQSASSLRTHLIAEAHEVAHAIAHEGDAAACAELGDLLFVTASIAETYAESGAFTLDDALLRVHEKMIRRHPHVFGDADTAPDWEATKAAERPEGTPSSALDGRGTSLPPLLRAELVVRESCGAGQVRRRHGEP